MDQLGRMRQANSFALRSTTILSVRHRGHVAIAGDGQVSLGNVVMKHGARKVRRMYNDQVIASGSRRCKRCQTA